MTTPLDFLKAKVQAVKDVLERTSPKERENMVSVHQAREFNAVLKEIGEACPDSSPHLPKPIPSTTHLAMGLSDVGYVDLMIMAEQVLQILSVIESHG